MADTALTLITDALLDLGVLADEESPTASQAVGGLRKLNNLIDAWNIEGLMVYGSTPNILPLVAGTGAYTIGLGGNLNIPRPSAITSVYVRDTTQPVTNQFDYALDMYNDQQWADVPFKNQQSAWPNWGVWIDQTFPLLTIHVNPVPSGSQYALVIWTSNLIGNLALTDPIQLAPGYKRALTANLAIELAASYGVQVPETVVRIARASKADIKVQNVQINDLSIDPRLAWGQFNIVTGYAR